MISFNRRNLFDWRDERETYVPNGKTVTYDK